MRFALNYSPAAARLYQSGMIALDLFKSADFPEMIADARRYAPIYVHFGLESGPGRAPEIPALARTRDDTATPFINTHLSCRRRDFPSVHGHRPDPAEDAAVARRFLADLADITRVFGPVAVIAENLIYHGPAHDDFLLPAINPAVITQVIAQSGCGLLLDLSHARIAAHYTGQDPKSYIRALPLHALKELHITGLAMHDGLLTDHLPMTDDDYAFFTWALAEIRRGHWATPDIVAFEYGGTGAPFAWRTDPAVLVSQVPRLHDMTHST